jgi:5'-nucleotidase
MITPFNRLNVQVSCLGNHDLDYGIDKSEQLTAMTSPCQWIISNITLAETGRAPGNLPRIAVKTHKVVCGTSGEVKLIKVGYLGMAGADWIGTMSCMVNEELEY